MVARIRQFDVLPNPVADAGLLAPYLVVVQHDLIETPTVLVAPLVREEHLKPVEGLHLSFPVAGAGYVLAMSDLFPILRNSLTPIAVANLSARRDEIVRALDRLFFGF